MLDISYGFSSFLLLFVAVMVMLIYFQLMKLVKLLEEKKKNGFEKIRSQKKRNE